MDHGLETRATSEPQAASLTPRTPQAVPVLRLIGLDAATKKSGYAAIDVINGGAGFVLVECGVATARGKVMHERLPEMFNDLGDRVAEFVRGLGEDGAGGTVGTGGRVIVSVERGYVSPRTLNNAIPMGAAFACAVLAAESARSDLRPGVRLEIVEVSPSEVKAAGCGSGRGDKGAMRAGVMHRLGLDESPPEDAADAIAVALAGWKKASGKDIHHRGAENAEEDREEGGLKA